MLLHRKAIRKEFEEFDTGISLTVVPASTCIVQFDEGAPWKVAHAHLLGLPSPDFSRAPKF